MLTRRTVLLQSSGILATSTLFGKALGAAAPEAPGLESLAGKQPLIKRAYRPPNYETPVAWLQEPITPNDRFFVRWHLANIPAVDVSGWRLSVGGDAVTAPRSFTLEELRRDFQPVEVVAVCQCAGNQRGLTDPRVPGVQWGVGAVGNARWRGVRLRDLLERAGYRKDVVLEVAFNGGDGPVLEVTPDFVKSLPAAKALHESTLIAYEMNGAALPHFNGFPARLIVPGWAGTYWVKQLISVEARTQPFAGFWMKSAYRVPMGKFPGADPFTSQEADGTTPITNIDLNALITSVRNGERVKRGAALHLQGVAWDAGQGIRSVEVSGGTGQGWQQAELGPDLGAYAFRPWRLRLVPRTPGTVTLSVRAVNRVGLTQPDTWTVNPAGYHNNVTSRTTIEVI